MKLNVGQIVYVIPEKQTAVHPMLVDEEIIKRTLLNNEISTDIDYSLRQGGASLKHWHLSNIQGEVFESAEHARSVMIDRATRSINKHIEIAMSKAAEWFGGEAKHQASVAEDVEENEETAYVDLGNGIKGKVKLSP